MTAVRIFHNLAARDRGEYRFQDVQSLASAQSTHAEISECPLYRATLLRDLPTAAKLFDLGQVLYKDESTRFGLDCFKALGGAYAVAKMVLEQVRTVIGGPVSIARLARGEFRALTEGLTVTCASDGNHGRAVAAGARHFGCRCVVFLHPGVSAGRAQAIRDLGAEVVRTVGDYDDSVEAAAETAKSNDWLLVADTAVADGDLVPRTVMQGYSVLFREVLEQLSQADAEPPTHVILQGGVGGLAAAAVAYLWERLGAAAPEFLIVEPDRADCLFQSALAGRPAPAQGDLETVMAGLSCGEVSEVAWPILAAGAAYFLTIDDASAVAAMRLLASGELGERIVAGESGAAGLAALMALSAERKTGLVGLNPDSRVLLIGTEGATDPHLYKELVGVSAAIESNTR